MKRFVIVAVLASMALGACGNLEEDEKIYTAGELGMIIEWNYSGWSEVMNETDETVTLVTTYTDLNSDIRPTELTSVIKPGNAVQLKSGAFIPGVSIGECLTATIKLGDGTEIVCTRGYYESRYDCHYDDPWSERFFGNYEQRGDYEVRICQGKKVRHDLTIRTYHIDKTLVNVWTAGQ
jgi:hypothetical protein